MKDKTTTIWVHPSGNWHWYKWIYSNGIKPKPLEIPVDMSVHEIDVLVKLLKEN